MNGPSTQRRGFTFAEMLTVIAIIGILVVLLLPAVQACREAARRSHCGNNLQQLMLAIQNYENLHTCYPPGTTDSKRPILSQPIGHHHNWISRILPFLDRRNAFDAVDWRAGVYDPPNLPVRRLHLDVLNCLSSPNQTRGYSSYAGMHHDIEAPIDITNNGVFYLNSRIQYEDLLDGISKTIFVGEKLVLRGDLGWMSGTRSTLRNTGVQINARGGSGRTLAGYFPTYAPPGTTESPAIFDRPLSAKEFQESTFTNRDLTYGTLVLPKDPRLAVGGFSSFHPGGAQFGLGDGSVRFISETIDAVTYGCLAHRADGALLPSNGEY